VVLRWTIGYGYRPALALIHVGWLLVLGWWLFNVAYQDPNLLRPAKSGGEQLEFHSFRYTMDLLLPVVNFKQRDAFVAEGWAAWASFGSTFVGWLLAAVVVAGLTGVPGNGPAWFGGGPRGKGVSTTETTSPRGLSCPG
jgi:hypothetical protein